MSIFSPKVLILFLKYVYLFFFKHFWSAIENVFSKVCALQLMLVEFDAKSYFSATCDDVVIMLNMVSNTN